MGKDRLVQPGWHKIEPKINIGPLKLFRKTGQPLIPGQEIETDWIGPKTNADCGIVRVLKLNPDGTLVSGTCYDGATLRDIQPIPHNTNDRNILKHVVYQA